MHREFILGISFGIVLAPGTIAVARFMALPPEDEPEASAPFYQMLSQKNISSEEHSANAKEITIRPTSFAIDPKIIRVHTGDTVRLHIETKDVAYGVYLPEFGINTLLTDDNTQSIEFVADKPGTYGIFCLTFCGDETQNLEGTLVVE